MNSELAHPKTPTVRSPQASPARTAAVSLKRWRHDDVEFNNLVRAGARIDLSALEPGTVLELHPCPPSPQAALGHAGSTPGPAERLLCLQGSAGCWSIEQGTQWIRALTNIPLDLTTESAEQAWLLATAAALLPAPLGRMFNTIYTLRDMPADPRQQKACLVLRTTDHVLTTYGYATGAVWQQMFGGQPRRPESFGAWSGWRSVVCHHSVMVGCHVLSQAQMQQLRVGDIVLPQQTYFDVHGQGRLRLGVWQLDVQNTAGPELEVLAMYLNSENPEINDAVGAPLDETSAQNLSATADAANLSMVPIQLQFELGLLSMTLGQMQSISVGSVVRLQTPATPPSVRILAGGQAIGKGELVDVEGQLGIQITSWAGA